MARAVSLEDQAASDEVVDAVIAASRVLVGVAARSIAAITDDVTLPQYRALVILVSRGPQRIADVAAILDVEPSTATRMSERLVRKRLVNRTGGEDDRRVVLLSATRLGRELVASVTRKRRAEVRAILRRMPQQKIEPLITSLHAFTTAAGETAEANPALGWAP